MNVLIAGSSGMIGSLVLRYCLDSEQIDQVRSLVRRPSEVRHPKLQEFVIRDFETYKECEPAFMGVEAAFFCVGAYTGQVPDDLFKKITVDYAVGFARMLSAHSPASNLCLLSGAGADRSEKSRTSFARYKGMAESQISSLNLTSYSFRPAYIYPVTRRKEPNLGYSAVRMLYPLIKLLGTNYSIRSTALASAMVHVGLHGADKQILENRDILEYARK